MLKKPASFVLASLGTSTYRKEYASVPRSLRPRWTGFLSILRCVLTASALARTYICAFLFSASLLIGSPAAASFADEMDRMWRDMNPVPKDQCRMFIVKAWPDKIYRGRTSPHDCLVHAIRTYRAGDHEEAFGWIQASVCPDRELQQAMVRNASAVLRHLLGRYSDQVP